jgi:type II secretory pathway pseudopilin PulG
MQLGDMRPGDISFAHMHFGFRRSGGRARQGGFSYLVLLFVVAIFGISLGVVLPIWSEVMRKDREDALIERANTLVRAIRSYATSTRSGPRTPTSLTALLEDRRSGSLRRHLRSLPPDPVTHSETWGLIVDASGGIIGVHSLSKDRPLRDQLPEGAVGPAPAAQYADWQFLVDAPAATPRPKG